MRNKKSVAIYLVMVIGVLIFINILSERYFFRLDFTADKRYTLSKATKDILKSLYEPVTITAYFTKDLPPQYLSLRKDFKDILIEYSSLSDGMLVYEFVNPNKDEESEQKAMQEGIHPRIRSRILGSGCPSRIIGSGIVGAVVKGVVEIPSHHA